MRVCVFCSSSDGLDPRFYALAADLGQRLGQRGDTVVFGGGRIGMMGALARAAVAAGGRVIGVYPAYFTDLKEPAATEHVVTRDLAERKAYMTANADAFIVLPGGLGTLDELFDTLAPKSLKLHRKPVIVVNPDGFYDGLFAFLDDLLDRGFLRPEHRQLWQLVPNVDSALARLDAAGA